MVMNYAPYSYSELNLVDGTYTPSETHNADDYLYWYWFRALFQRATSTLDFKLPDTLTAESKDFFYYCLFKYGYVVFFKSVKYGIIFQPCTLLGFDVFYQPTNAIVTNPNLTESIELTLHENAELVKLSPDYLGVFDIIDFYASKLANMSCSLDMTIENSKTAFVLTGKSKSAIQTLKKIVDKISQGITTIVFDSRVVSPSTDIEPFTWLTRNAKDSYIGSDLLENMQTLLNDFDREIGIPTIPYEKKERMVDFESKSAIIDASSRLATWIKSLDESIAAVNKMFNLEISYDTRIDNIDALSDIGGDINE